MTWISRPIASLSLRRSSGEVSLGATLANLLWLISCISGVEKRGNGSLSGVKISRPSAPIVETWLPRPPGTWSGPRWPGAARPYTRGSPRLLPLSSIKTDLLSSRAPVSLRNCWRAFSSRSLAPRLFFSGELELLQGATQGGHAHPSTPLGR